MDVEMSVTKIGSLRVYLGASPLFMHAKQPKFYCVMKLVRGVLFVCGDVFLLEPIVGSGFCC